MNNKTDLGKCKKLLDCGLSLLTVGDNKVPNFPWKKLQKKAYSKNEFEKHYSYAGGVIKQNGEELPATSGIGIVTGYNGLEVIDVDLKVLPTLSEQESFWSEYYSMLCDNISDFESKFVIYKTINNGYHILYKCSKIDGNKKIAKKKGCNEAIIETRGIGGYVFIYDKQVSKKSYNDIQEISELERECLFEVSKVFDDASKEEEHPKPKKDGRGIHIDLSVWDDYNDKTDIFDVIGDEFTVVRTLKDRYVIKRHGAKSSHSGYVYKNSGCMFLFSSGTIYPQEKLISPYYAYTVKNHNGNFEESAKHLYRKGFGSRAVSVPRDIEDIEKNLNVNDLEFPIDIFPKELQAYILLCNKTLDNSIDYMGCSLMWLVSVIVGNSIKIEVKKGWNEPGVLWISVVGKPGIGKTPSLSSMLFPLQKANNRELKRYIKEKQKFEDYKDLTAEEKKYTEKLKEPKKSQFIANDITLEALVELHEESKNAVGIFKDELAGWLKDMNKYRAGSDLEFWLSSWSGSSVALNRKTAKSSFVEKPFIPVLGGIQPGILNSFFTDENKDNGFIDRMLLCYPDLEVEKYNSNDMGEDILRYYEDYIIMFYDQVKSRITQYDDEGEVFPHTAVLDDDARIEWERVFNDITDMQNSDSENEYMKSMLPKQKSYIPRFALLINTLNVFHNETGRFLNISKQSILDAERLSKYFIAMAKKIKINSSEVNDIKNTIGKNNKKSKYENFIDIYERNKDVNRTSLAEILGVSRQTIQKYVAKYEESVN